MKKIISLYQRNYETDRRVRDEVVPGAEWVIAGEGRATRKYDGTCTMVRGGKLYKRYELKQGKTPPIGFEPATTQDPKTGKTQGWVEVGWGNEDRYYREALKSEDPDKVDLPDGTYELVGPKVQGNPDEFDKHTLVPHGEDILEDAPREFEAIKAYLKDKTIEGIVWHRENGEMVKIKRKDFNYSESK